MTTADLTPAEAWPVGTYIEEELEARGWCTSMLARRMPNKDDEEAALNLFCVEMLIAVHDKKLILDRDTAEKLAQAFDVSPDYFLNLDKAWREHGPHPENDNRIGDQ